MLVKIFSYLKICFYRFWKPDVIEPDVVAFNAAKKLYYLITALLFHNLGNFSTFQNYNYGAPTFTTIKGI